MPKTVISKNEGCSILIEINLDDLKWRSYSPEFLPPFNAEELVRSCVKFIFPLFSSS